MLSKLGWSKGKTLGKTNTNTGLLEPINVIQYESKKGLGCENATVNAAAPILSKSDKMKMENWNKTRERFQTLGKSSDIFGESDEST